MNSGGRRSNRGHGSALDGTFHSVDMSDPISNGGGTTGADQKDRDGDGSGTSSCSRIYEGPQVNVYVTSSGATVALGLMYLKTNNLSVADRLKVPHTLFLLDYVRPDLLMLRQMCLGLVMWDSVELTLKWVQQQVPETLRIATGVEMKTKNKFTTSNEDGNTTNNASSTGPIGKVDRLGYAQAYANIITGALLSIGFRYAGTAHGPAHATLSFHVERFQSMLINKGGNGNKWVVGESVDSSSPCTYSNGTKPDRTTLEMCLGAAATSLGMVMSGTGELTTLRLLRKLRLRNVRLKKKKKLKHQKKIKLMVG